MKHLLNTLYILSEDIYLSLDGENVVAGRDKQAVARYPLHTLQNIITFSYAGASPALMGACAQRQIGLAFCTPRGRSRPGCVERGMGMFCFAGRNTGSRTIPASVARSAVP